MGEIEIENIAIEIENLDSDNHLSKIKVQQAKIKKLCP